MLKATEMALSKIDSDRKFGRYQDDTKPDPAYLSAISASAILKSKAVSMSTERSRGIT